MLSARIQSRNTKRGPMRFLLLALLLPMFQTPPLASYVDQNRVLLVIAPSDRDTRYQQQLKLLSHHAHELKERDILLLPVVQAVTPSDTLRTLASPYPSPSQQLDLRARFRIQPSEFAVILLGKDGGEKLRQAVPITVEKLSATIDAMPMRQDEIRQRQQKAPQKP